MKNHGAIITALKMGTITCNDITELSQYLNDYDDVCDEVFFDTICRYASHDIILHAISLGANVTIDALKCALWGGCNKENSMETIEYFLSNWFSNTLFHTDDLFSCNKVMIPDIVDLLNRLGIKLAKVSKSDALKWYTYMCKHMYSDTNLIDVDKVLKYFINNGVIINDIDDLLSIMRNKFIDVDVKFFLVTTIDGIGVIKNIKSDVRIIESFYQSNNVLVVKKLLSMGYSVRKYTASQFSSWYNSNISKEMMEFITMYVSINSMV